MKKLVIDDLPDAGDRFILEECLGTGVCGKVHAAIDTSKSRKKRVAIKMQKINKETVPFIVEEHRVLSEFSTHINLPDFYGAFRKVGENDDEVWFVMELCEGGPVTDLVNGLLQKNRRMAEEHIAHILKEVVRVLIHLHENNVIHRDVKAKNILLTKEGEVKLIDFGISKYINGLDGKTNGSLGSPCWMAPELVHSSGEEEETEYGNRIDVWSLGVLAIELGEGKAPFEEMHPSRALFQILRNPPPALYRPGNWTEMYNDFINECLIKNPEHRPYMIELLEHPFLTEVPENNYHLSCELKLKLEDYVEIGRKLRNQNDFLVKGNTIKYNRDGDFEKIHVEDLCALDRLTEETILQELKTRMHSGHFHSFLGDILLFINPNEEGDMYGDTYHQKYNSKSRSDNEPHIYAVADHAFQAAHHHLIPQNVVLGGESGSGKTTNYLHLLDHLLYLGANPNINNQRIKDAVKLIHAFTHASTPYNDYSTRSFIKTEVTFGRTEKVSGAIFTTSLLEKWRISSMDMSQSNYHMLYYLYDGLEASGHLEKYLLPKGRKLRYLRVSGKTSKTRPRDNPEQNVKKFVRLLEILKSYDFSEEQIDWIQAALAAVLLIGEIRFGDSGSNTADVDNEQVADYAAQILDVDEKKFAWALTNYCLVKKGTAIKRKHSCDQARDARDVLANTLYVRLVDYVVGYINYKLTFGRKIFGEKYSVRIFDIFGFECFKENHLPQLFINCFNEQVHYHFLQRVFAWEALELNEEEVPFVPFRYFDNRNTLDEILNKQDGLLTLVDNASKMGRGGEYITDFVRNPQRKHIQVINSSEFAIAHYTGKVTYDSREMADRNRDFLPPELIEIMRTSKNEVIRTLFTNKLSRNGNLLLSFGEESRHRFRSNEDEFTIKLSSEQQYSQIKKMRTSAATFRALCLDLLKELSVGGGSGGTHFVQCVRSDLEGRPRNFNAEIVKQQLRAMSVLETAKARKKGYPHRVSFSEFIRRYKFLAFGFDENVEVTRDNCRLLLIRLKMEGWMIGKTKVFLKYYNEEYLARLYETQVKKIIKIQSTMRGFLAKLRIKKKIEQLLVRQQSYRQTEIEMDEEKAAKVLQRAYRMRISKKIYRPMQEVDYEDLDASTCDFLRPYALKWKTKSIFQVLLQYRAARYQDMFNLSQQIHLFNQNAVCNILKINTDVDMNLIDGVAKSGVWLGEKKPTVLKLPFRLDEIPYFDTSYMCDPLTNVGASLETEDEWDAPFRWRETVSAHITSSLKKEDQPKMPLPQTLQTSNFKQERRPTFEHIVQLPYNRDPNEPVRRLSSVFIDADSIEVPALPENVVTPKEITPPRDENISNSKPANKDFEYIKSTTITKPLVNPIAELQNLGRRKSSVSDDEPPFNFQGMLRKTNVNRNSMKKIAEGIRSFSMKKREKEASENEKNSNERGLKKHKSMDQLESEKQKLELGPGIFIEGVVSDL